MRSIERSPFLSHRVLHLRVDFKFQARVRELRVSRDVQYNALKPRNVTFSFLPSSPRTCRMVYYTPRENDGKLVSLEFHAILGRTSSLNQQRYIHRIFVHIGLIFASSEAAEASSKHRIRVLGHLQFL